MILVLLGLNHKTAPVEVREKLACLFAEPAVVYQRLRQLAGVQEAIYFSTCNRVEVLVATPEPEAVVPALTELLVALPEGPADQLRRAIYQYREEEAIRHLFRVACGLDSLVMGEPQILGQVKAAYRTATEHQATGPLLNRLLHKTFSVAKRVRTETGIGGLAVSVSYAAVELARKIFGSLTGKRGLLIGAGEMAELALEHLKRHGVAEIVIANRTLAHGQILAERFQGRAVPLSELPECLLQADIIISSTGAPDFLLTRDQVKAAMRRRKQRPLFLIDIAVPRDLDPAINDLDNVYLYNIDDLQQVVAGNLRYRQSEAVKAEEIVAAETRKFLQWREQLAVYPTIIALKDKARQICAREVRKTLSHFDHLTPAQRQAIEILAASVADKLLHDPLMYLKRNHHPKDRSRDLDFIRRLFNLDPDRLEDLKWRQPGRPDTVANKSPED